jgi:outer membrane protein TolC
MRPRSTPALVAALVTALAVRSAPAQSPPAPPPAVTVSYTEAIRLALQQRPKVRAARITLARAEAQHAETDRLARLLGHVRRDLPARREQAALGVEVARADLEAQEADVRYAAGRMYVSVLYATSARRLARKAVDRVEQYRAALAGLKGPLPSLDPFLAELASAPTLQAENKLIEADKAEAIALAAFRQAVGADAAAPLAVPDAPLPRPSPEIPDAAEVSRLVLARSPGLRRAALLERVHQWEVEAQGRLPLALVADTFAASADVHAAAIPPEGADEYRPAPIVPEMPVRLTGPKAARVEAARLYAAKATEITRGVERLLALRVAATWETLREKRRKLEALERRHAGRMEKIDEALAKPPGKGWEALLQQGILAIAAAADLETARYEYLVALLDLERLTLGAFCPGVGEALGQARP